MSWMNEIGTLLQQYQGAAASSPPPSTNEDFAKVADRAPAAAGSLNTLGGASATAAPAEAQQLSSEAVQQLAEEAQRRDPSIVDKASEFYAQHPALVQTLGVGALAVIMSHLSQRH